MSRKKKKPKKVKLKLVKKTKKRKVKVVKKPRVKKNRRSQSKFPALEKKFNLLSRKDLIDYDYLDKLNDKEKKWLNKFTEEYINDSLDRKNLRKNLHNTKRLKKDCDDMNNSRNRCVLTRNKIIGNVQDISTVKEASQLNPEELMIRAQEKELEEMENFNNGFDSTEDGE